LFLAFFLGGIAGAIWIIVYKKGLKEAVPYGPMIVLGGFLSLIWGEAIIKWYVGLLRF